MRETVFIPYAVFCEGFQQADDGNVVIGRVLDAITCIQKSGPIFRRKRDQPVVKVTYAVCFKSSEPVHKLQTELRCTRPSGTQFVVGTKTLDLRGEYKGTFLTGELVFSPQESGWHIFDVLVEGIVETRMVLNISIQWQTIKEKLGILANRKKAGPKLQKHFSHPKCYAGVLGNCSKEISREHFISKNILEELDRNGGLRVGGMPWNTSGTAAEISPASLTAKVLCGHHNSLLSDLDVLGGRFFRVLNAIHAAASGGSQTSLATAYEFDGNGVERFFLKILLGGVASGNLRGPNGIPMTKPLDASLLRVLFGEAVFQPPVGLFVLGELNVPWLVDQPLQAGALVDDGNLVGILVSVAPLRFLLAVVPPNENSPLLCGKSFYRPTSISMRDLPHGKLVFNWDGEGGNEDIVVGTAPPPRRIGSSYLIKSIVFEEFCLGKLAKRVSCSTRGGTVFFERREEIKGRLELRNRKIDNPTNLNVSEGNP